MAGMDFPSTPVNGQVFDPGTGTLYQWNGAQWDVYTGTHGTADPDNIVFNPSMQVSQENGTTNSAVSTASASYFVADQWAVRWSTAPATMLGSHGPNRVPDELSNSPDYASCYCAAGKASLAANDHALITQNIEGDRLADLMWGTSKAIPAVLRFVAVHTSGGTYSVRLINAASDRTFVAQFTLAPNVWKLVEIPIPAPPDGVWPRDVGAIGARLDFASAIGSTYIGVLGWQNGNFYGAPGNSNGITTGNTTLGITDVGLYADPRGTGKAPPYKRPRHSEMYLQCLRYWQKIQMRGPVIGAAYNSVALTNQLPVPMRSPPVVSYNDMVGNPNRISGTGVNNITVTAGSLSATQWAALADLYAGSALAASGGGWWGAFITLNARM